MRRTDLGSSINRNLKKKNRINKESTKNQQRINKKLKQKKEAV